MLWMGRGRPPPLVTIAGRCAWAPGWSRPDAIVCLGFLVQIDFGPPRSAKSNCRIDRCDRSSCLGCFRTWESFEVCNMNDLVVANSIPKMAEALRWRSSKKCKWR